MLEWVMLGWLVLGPVLAAVAFAFSGPGWWSRVAYGALMLVLPVAFPFWLARRLRARRTPPSDDASVQPRPKPPMVEPPEDDEFIPEPVRCCPDCGFLGIRMAGVQDGAWPGAGEIGAQEVCPRCLYRGMPVEFSRRDDYVAFLSEGHAA